jgi:hypothetical protein
LLNKLYISIAWIGLLMIQACSLEAQTTLQNGADQLNIQQKTVLEEKSLDQAPVDQDSCETKFPFPVSKSNDPYYEDGTQICEKLKIRGQRLQCEIDSIVENSSDKKTTGAKIQLAAWARCNAKVATLLMNGYYLPASEIERRLHICSSNFYADPGEPPKFGLYQRFLRWVANNDLTPPPTDKELETTIKESIPLESSDQAAGLMRCSWMFSVSKTPTVNPLPMVADNPVASTPIAKKSVVKKKAKPKAQQPQ